MRLVGQLSLSCKGDVSSSSIDAQHIDDFKMACISGKVKFVKYVLNITIITIGHGLY
jgi:hypothetical protein